MCPPLPENPGEPGTSSVSRGVDPKQSGRNWGESGWDINHAWPEPGAKEGK